MEHNDNPKYPAPSSPPPGYNQQLVSPQSTGTSPYYHQPTPSHPNNTQQYAMVPYNQGQQQPQQQQDFHPPESVYNNGYTSPAPPQSPPPPGGYYGPPIQNNFYTHPGHAPPPGGYYGPHPQYQQPLPQHYQQPQMYYAAPHGPPAGYYQDTRGMSAGSGICAGLLSALACVCCLDLLLF